MRWVTLALCLESKPADMAGWWMWCRMTGIKKRKQSTVLWAWAGGMLSLGINKRCRQLETVQIGNKWEMIRIPSSSSLWYVHLFVYLTISCETSSHSTQTRLGFGWRTTLNLILLPLPPELWDYMREPPDPVSWRFGDWIQVFVHVKPILNQLRHIPSPYLNYLWEWICCEQ